MSISFLEGMGTVVDLFASEKETTFCLPTHSDAEAINKDWQQVGNDIRSAANSLHSSGNQK